MYVPVSLYFLQHLRVGVWKSCCLKMFEYNQWLIIEQSYAGMKVIPKKLGIKLKLREKNLQNKPRVETLMTTCYWRDIPHKVKGCF